MSKKFTHFGRICVTYVLVLALVFSFVMSSFVGLNITASAQTSPNPSEFDLWEGNKPTSLEGLNMNGLGTKASPYEITNPDQLWFAVNNTDATKYFKVMNNININDASSFDTWTDTNPDGVYDWNPSATFVGDFDGNNKTITGLYASTNTNTRLGLFSSLGTNANIYNVIVDRAYFRSTNTSMTMVGGIAGGSVKGDNVKIFGCVVKNSKITGYSSSAECGAGGIIGGVYENDSANAYNVTIANCVAVDNTLSGAKWKAGIIGANWGTYITLSNCYTTTYSIAHSKTNVTATACYTTADATQPYSNESQHAFGDTTKVYQVAKDNMKNLTALDAGNMDLFKSSEWILSEGNYPMPKAYRDVYTFLASDKNIEDTAYAGGDGSRNNPYQITNAAQLYKAVNNTDASLYFKVMNDIIVNDTSNFAAWTNSESFEDWTPVTTTTKFAGNFNGNQKTIYGLYSSGAYADTGLFAQVDSNATIYDVFVENAYFYSTAGSARIGGLVGRANKTVNVYIYGCTVKNSKFAATYIANNYNENSVAGLVGSSYGNATVSNDVTIENCYAVDNTFLDANKGLWSAGLIGSYWTGTLIIKNCFTDDVFGHKRDAATHTNCYTSADDPFNSDSYTFADTTGRVNQIAKADMTGAAALTNMGLDPVAWTVVENGYPVPVAYTILNAFTAADKDINATTYAGGTGAKNDPYQITNAAQLFKAVNNTDATKYFKVMNDITINNVANFATWTKDSSFVDWDPTETFAGTFDGNQKTIKGLYSSSSNQFLGLFSRVASNTVIYDVIIDHAYIWYTGSSGMAMTGGLIGTAQSTTDVYLYGCIVRNSVIKGKGGAAGLVGGAWSQSGSNTITLKSCYAVDNTVTGASWISGLMAARWGNTSAVMTDCFTTGYSLGHQALSATTTNCYVSGDEVTAPFFGGGSFADGKVEKIDNGKMKGIDALTELNLSATDWTAVVEDYPMPRSYASVHGNFTAADKDMDAVIFEGEGTLEDPYKITNPAELWKAVHNTDATKHFKVMNDIVINDTAAFADWNNNSSYTDWIPNATFVGTFNGNQKTIKGLYASTSSSSNKWLGLFSRVGSDALIYDVIIDQAYISHFGGTPMSLVGGLIGTVHNANNVYVYGCIVKNSKILNSHTGDAGEAGLIGGAYSTVSTPCVITLENCYAVDNTHLGVSGWATGLMGARWTSKSVIKNCFTTGSALEHQALNATATNCYVTTDAERPFAYDENAQFGDTTGVYQIDNAMMKGDLALENMKFSSKTWTIVADNYPMPKPYVLEKDAWLSGDPVTSFVQLEGDGTKESPYLITNGDELWFVVNNTEKIGASSDQIPYFRLENDIKLNALANYKNWGTEAPANTWLPTANFVGHFDGNYKTISGLYAAPSTEASAGLFAAVDSGSTVKNLTLDKSYIKATAGTTDLYVGGIVGKVDGEANVALEGLSVKNSILEGRGLTGGIVGLIANSTGPVVVERASSVDNTITDLNGAEYAAGLVGDVVNNEANTAVISHSFTTSNYISRQSNSAIFNNVYTTDDMAKPFAAEDTAFDGTSVINIPLANMKGDSAITNMKLVAGYWEAVADSYPVVKTFLDPNNFKASDKTLTVADLQGAGTSNDPKQITNAAELWAAVNNTDSTLYFKVMNDITVNNTDEFAAWDDNSEMENWTPTEKFVGVFDGNKKVISGLYASSSTDKQIGLFRELGNETKILDVIIDKAYMAQTSTTTTQTMVGGLVGRVYGASDVAIYGCVVKNSKILNRFAGGAGEGGLIGGAYSPSSSVGDITLVNCYAVDNTQLGICDWSSGLMAARWTTKSTMIDCFTTDYSIEHQFAGGSATNCYVSGDVEYPFSYQDTTPFGETSGVYKIDNAKMKGADALTNMKFDSKNWKATDSYPESLVKLVINDGTVGEVWSGVAARTFAGGDGTEANPWQIDTPERFAKMINAYGTSEHWFVLTADIKLNDTTAADWYTSDSVNPWINGKKFIGHIDGQGYTVSGLYVKHDASFTSGAGLIPQASGNATITNINLDNCYIVGDLNKESYTGALVGYAASGIVRIAGCNVSNVLVDKVNRFGGILGASSTGVSTIDYCTFEGQMIADNYGTKYVGGIIGDSWGTVIVSNSISKGIVAIGKASSATYAVYSDVSQTQAHSNKLNVISVNAEDMIGSAAKSSMDKLNWKYFETDPDGIPTAKNIDLSTSATMGTPGAVWSGFAAPGYASGTGTVGDPYLISTAEQLYRFTLESKARFKNADAPTYVKITHDIYLNDVSDENWKEKDNLNQWRGSGSLSGSFVGHVDGDYHVIYGMYTDINSPTATALVIAANAGSTFSRLGFAEGYLLNQDITESYSAAFVGFISAKGSQGKLMEDGTYTPIKFTECFVDETFEVYGYYAGGFVGGTPMGVDFVDCYSNAYIGDGAKYSGAFIGNAFDSRYPDSFTTCYSFPASKWTSFSDVSEITFPGASKKGMREGAVTDCYYFGSAVTYFPLLFYKDMYGDAAKTNMTGFDFDRVWKTVDGGSPVLRGFANADDFTSSREVYTTVSLVSGTEEIVLPDMEGIALSPLDLPELERDGYFFGGWFVYEEGACEYDYDIYPVVDTTLYAKWNANSVTQNFENYVNTKYDYDEDYTYYRPGVSGYSSMKVHGGGKAMFRKGESDKEQDLILNATEPIAAGEEYRISFWVAAEEADTKATISLVHYTWPDFQDPNLGVEKMVEIDSLEVGKWTSYTYKFKASTPWLGIRTSGNAKLYLDDFFITPVEEFMKDASKVNDYDYFYSLGETDKNGTAQTLSARVSTPVNTLAPTSAVSTEDTNNTVAFLLTVILAASALVVISRASLGNFEQEIENDIEE